MSKVIDIFLCKTDFDYHIPDDLHGVTVYFSEENIKKCRVCAEYCGIVKLQLDLSTMQVVQQPKKEEIDA